MDAGLENGMVGVVISPVPLGDVDVHWLVLTLGVSFAELVPPKK